MQNFNVQERDSDDERDDLDDDDILVSTLANQTDESSSDSTGTFFGR